jgi:hypothetical protein
MAGPPPDDTGNLARQRQPMLSVDSTFPGYRAAVLADGRWIASGEETTQEYSNPDRLGNGGNSWVSAAQEGAEHWARLDWPAPIRVNQLELWWTQDLWFPKAFRVERLVDRAWVPVTAEDKWFAATARRSLLSFKPVETQSIRVLQHAHGGGERGVLALQEVRVFDRPEIAPGIDGARELTGVEQRRLAPIGLPPNLARLHEKQPGASRAVVWHSIRPTAAVECPSLADGDCAVPARVPAGVRRVGVKWPIQHVTNGAVLWFVDRAPDPLTVSLRTDAVRLLIHSGDHWLPLTTGLDRRRAADGKRLVFTFEPVACDAIAFHLRAGCPRLAELGVQRYLPKAPNVWPDRLVTANQFEREFLASRREASFEYLSSVALSMSPARALLGLKDMPWEVGVAWDGTLLAQDELQFSFGAAAKGDEEEALAEYRDTVTRTLLDGWRPGTIVRGRIRDLRVKQTAFVSFAGTERTLPALFVRLEVTNVAGAATPVRVQLKLTPRRAAGVPGVTNGCLVRDDKLIMATTEAPVLGDDGRVQFDVPCPAQIDLVFPQGQAVAAAEAGPYRVASLDGALTMFRKYWDETLASANGRRSSANGRRSSAVSLDLPERRLNDLYRGVLTQLFINADGDVMPYGAYPSVYDGNLYGVEEGFAMMALASFGFSADAQRYMDGTYLTPDFLKKVPEYKAYPDRHQQYRNGLQPMYAVSAYRLSGDREWITKHLDTLRQCAEWTIENRRKTRVLEDGRKPLHWGLLPKWSYGGDIANLQCYALYANFACWRGLQDTAWLLEQLGDTASAQRYSDEAAEYREVLAQVVDANLQRDQDPPFLPLQLYATKPVGDDYDQLFAGILLDLLPFDLRGGQSDYLTDYLERANLLFCGLPRFRRDVGPGGLDGLYGLGYLLTKLHQDRIDEFLLGFCGYLAFNMERATFASRETNLIYASDLHARSRYRVPDMSDPVPCSSAVALLLLRNMLVTERPEGPGLPSHQLRLLWGAPRAWFADGQRLRFAGMPTHFGEVSCEVVSRAAQGKIEARVVPPSRDPWAAIQLRLRHPTGAKMKRVTVNGKRWDQIDPDKELLTLLPGSAEYRILAEYRIEGNR